VLSSGREPPVRGVIARDLAGARFFLIVSGGNPPLYRPGPVGSGEQIRLSRRDPPFPPLDGELPSARYEDVELSWRIQR